jgi:hypothetical protein
MSKVFISYSSRDRADAFTIKELLELHQCDVWLDFFDLRPSAGLEQELRNNLQRADVVCLLLSPTSVASHWVHLEIAQALAQAEHGLHLLPVILRSCSIPEAIGGLVAIDATDGLDSEPVRLRIARAVCGAGAVQDGVLLDAAQRALQADTALRETAEQELPAIADDLAPVRQLPIREIRFTLDDGSLPVEQDVMLELRLGLDPLFSVPMSFYFARYREGSTWPQQFGFQEPPYTAYYFLDRRRVDAKFTWFERVEDLTPTIGSREAEFSLALSGEEFKPAGALNLPQTLQIPSLQGLHDMRSAFTLIAHSRASETATVVPLDSTDIDLRVDAYYRDHSAWCTLFCSTHSHAERVILGGEYLSHVDSAIEREALLGRYLSRARQREQPPSERVRIIQQYHESNALGADASDEERRIVADYLFEEAGVARLRGQVDTAIAGYRAVANMLQPLVFDRLPTDDDARLMYRACQAVAAYYVETRKFSEALENVQPLGWVTQRLLDLEPENADYRRAWASSVRTLALVHAETGEQAAAAHELHASVDVMRALAQELPAPIRLQDARNAVATALRDAALWGIASQLPVAEWREEAGEAGREAVARAIDEARTGPQLPAWVQPAEPEGWPTREIEAPLLRYKLRMCQRWSDTPQVHTTQMEVAHVYRGKSPAEWLIVSVMDKAHGGGNMHNWVDAIVAMTGFPVVEMIEGNTPPKLLEWECEGAFAELTARLGVDESLLYSGIAQMPGTSPLRAHVYMLMARRANFAWKVTLAFETALLPGLPEVMAVRNDHVRAGATYGHLRLL